MLARCGRCSKNDGNENIVIKIRIITVTTTGNNILTQTIQKTLTIVNKHDMFSSICLGWGGFGLGSGQVALGVAQAAWIFGLGVVYILIRELSSGINKFLLD